jgi:hypothetical protein
MSPMHIKIAVYGGALLLAWWLTERARAKAPTADVTLGVGTVDGEIGGDYQTPRQVTIAGIDTSNPGVNPDVREVIDRSNRILRESEVAGDNQ